MKYVSFAATLLLVMSGCASVSTVKEADANSISGPSQSSGQFDKELTAQQLIPGECGLFLWRRANTSQFIFFTKAGTETASFMFEGLQRQMVRTGFGGDIFGQFLTGMSYQTMPAEITIELALEPGEAMSGGQKVSSGFITVTDSAGWETIMPVTGVRACQPD